MSKHKKTLSTLIMIIQFILICFLLMIIWIQKEPAWSLTSQYETDFYVNLLKAASESETVYFRDLVTCEWDTVAILPVYQTDETKIEYAGYRYADDLRSNCREDILSLLFMKEGKVVYYVDSLAPWIFQYSPVADSKVMLKKSGSTSVIVEATILPKDTSVWFWQAFFTEAAFSENPYIEVNYSSPKGYLVLDIKK